MASDHHDDPETQSGITEPYPAPKADKPTVAYPDIAHTNLDTAKYSQHPSSPKTLLGDH